MRRRSPGAWVSFGGVILGLGLMGATVTLPSARTIPNGMAGTRLTAANRAWRFTWPTWGQAPASVGATVLFAAADL